MMVKKLQNVTNGGKKVRKAASNDTPVTVRLTGEYIALVDWIGQQMGIDGRATVLKHCLVMRARELGHK